MAASIPHGAPLRLVTASFQSPPAPAPSAEGIAFANSYLALTSDQQALFCEWAAAEGMDLPVAFFGSSRQRLRLVTAAPAAQPLAEPAAALGLCARELIISIWAGDWVTYEGTRAQLEDEGLIPEDAEWPARDSILEWKAGGLEFELHRTRPAGLKGPKRTWLEMDNWCVCVQTDQTDFRLDDWFAQCIEEKAEALRAEIHRYSPAGRREEATSCSQRWAAQQDKAFQAFKSTLLPPRKKPGRKPKAQAVDGPQQAV